MSDIYLATWTVLSMVVGGMFTLILVAVLSDREPPPDPPDDPWWDVMSGLPVTPNGGDIVIEWDVDSELDNVDDLITHGRGFFEANLLERP